MLKFSKMLFLGVLGSIISLPVFAQSTIDDQIPSDNGVTASIFLDGVNQWGQITDGFGRAYIDAASGEVLLELSSGSHVVSFGEILNAASAGNALRSSIISSEIDYVFRQGGVTLGYLANEKDSVSLNGPKSYCQYVGCDSAMSNWNYDYGVAWDLEQKRPPMPPPPPPPPRTEECLEAFAEVVDARLAVDAAEAVCKSSNGNRAKLVGCAVMVVYGAVRTSLAANRAAGCPVPTMPPPPPQTGYWGWNF